MLGLKRSGLSYSLNVIETLCTDASFFTEGPRENRSVEAEPGAGLLGNVKCTFRGLEALRPPRLVWEELGGFTWEALA